MNYFNNNSKMLFKKEGACAHHSCFFLCVLQILFPLQRNRICICFLLSGVLISVPWLWVSVWMLKIPILYLNLVKTWVLLTLWDFFLSPQASFLWLHEQSVLMSSAGEVALFISKKIKMELSVTYLKQFWSLAYLVFFFFSPWQQLKIKRIKVTFL